jgi:hypothetical protein
MRILLFHPEDSPRRGPWSGQHWDLIVDLGKSSTFSEMAWGVQYGCPVLRADSFRHGLADAQRLRELFSLGRGYLIDEEGIDWWEVMSLLLAAEGLSLLVLGRIASEISPVSNLWATRRGAAVRMLELLLDRSILAFSDGPRRRSAIRAAHYAELVRHLSPAQLKQIILDKYDAGYRWRSRFAHVPDRCREPVILLPSAYENVSRMAYAYASLLPEQRFLMVATRQSAKCCVPPANVTVRDLSAYAKPETSLAESNSLVDRWRELKTVLQDSSELRALLAVGVMDSFPSWIRNGLRGRDAWRAVLKYEPVQGVLCGDDTNLHTRLPVSLACHRKIPTVNFHHGAIDGRYSLKDLPSDLYLAKNEMERDYLLRVGRLPQDRVVVGAPAAMKRNFAGRAQGLDKASAIFFSEPYEVGEMRTEEVYRETLPPLCRLARENGRDVILKMHPFESAAQRRRIVRDVLAADDAKVVSVIDGPLTPELMERAWFGITVESTTVIDCLQSGVCCFLCRWLATSPYGYAEQYARFGVGEALEYAQQIAQIPRRLDEFVQRSAPALNLSPIVDAGMLKYWLTVYGSFGERAS